MHKQYLRTEFDQPKVKGLAVHNARKRTEAVEADVYPNGINNGPRLMYPFPPEVYAYCLFGVHPDCSVIPLASGHTAGEMTNIVTKRNLGLLANKYKLIGFVCSRTPGRRREYEVIQAPKQEGGAK